MDTRISFEVPNVLEKNRVSSHFLIFRHYPAQKPLREGGKIGSYGPWERSTCLVLQQGMIDDREALLTHEIFGKDSRDVDHGLRHRYRE